MIFKPIIFVFILLHNTHFLFCGEINIQKIDITNSTTNVFINFRKSHIEFATNADEKRIEETRLKHNLERIPAARYHYADPEEVFTLDAGSIFLFSDIGGVSYIVSPTCDFQEIFSDIMIKKIRELLNVNDGENGLSMQSENLPDLDKFFILTGIDFLVQKKNGSSPKIFYRSNKENTILEANSPGDFILVFIRHRDKIDFCFTGPQTTKYLSISYDFIYNVELKKERPYVPVAEKHVEQKKGLRININKKYIVFAIFILYILRNISIKRVVIRYAPYANNKRVPYTNNRRVSYANNRYVSYAK